MRQSDVAHLDLICKSTGCRYNELDDLRRAHRHLRDLVQEAVDDPYAQLTVSLVERMSAELARKPAER